MSLEKEIRIAKVQIMWTIAVATLGLFYIIRTTESIFDFLLIPIYMGVWYLGAISLRKNIEEEDEEE